MFSPTKHFCGVKLRDSERLSAQLHDELVIYDFEWRKLFIFARTLTLNFGKLLGSGESNVY